MARVGYRTWKWDVQLREALEILTEEQLSRPAMLTVLRQRFPTYGWSLTSLDRRLRFFQLTQRRGMVKTPHTRQEVSSLQSSSQETIDEREVFDLQQECEAEWIDAAAVKVVDKALVDFNSFPTVFKDQRISLGYTQTEASNNILHCTGYQIDQTTISLLECNKLERKKVEILYPHLMEWMTSARPQVYPLQLCGPRKKRKTFSNHELKVLRGVFEQKSRPSPQEVREVACSLHLDPVIVKRWFSNHRRKTKKQN